MSSAPALNSWTMPFSSVAMTEKLALLRMACCSAPDLTISSSTRTLARRALPASCAAVSDGIFLNSMRSSVLDSDMKGSGDLLAAAAIAGPWGAVLQKLDGQEGRGFDQLRRRGRAAGHGDAHRQGGEI